MDLWSLIPLLATIVQSVLIYIVYRKGRNATNNVFILFSLSLAYWSFSELGYFLANDFQTASLWVKFESFWPLSVALMMNFVSRFTENNQPIVRRTIYFLVYMPAVIFSAIELLTNWISSEPIIVAGIWTYGPPQMPLVFDISSFWAVMVSILSVYFCAKYYSIKADKTVKNQTLFILVGLSVPIVSGAITDGLSSMFQLRIPNLMSLAFLIEGIMMGYAIWKYKLFEKIT